jgi:hypothetical protein
MKLLPTKRMAIFFIAFALTAPHRKKERREHCALLRKR